MGDFAQLVRTLRPEDIHLFAAMSGDVNPTHVDLEYARSSQFREVVGHSMWGSTLISTVLGTEFPGPGTVYVSQGLNFWRPITIGDTLTITVTCKDKYEHNHHVVFDCLAVNQDGLKVIDGIAEVMAPTEKIARPRVVLPEVTVSDRELRYRHLLSVSAGLTPIPIAVAHPCDRESLLGPVQAATRRPGRSRSWSAPSPASSRWPKSTRSTSRASASSTPSTATPRPRSPSPCAATAAPRR